MEISCILKNLPQVFLASDAASLLAPHYKAPLKALAALEKRGVLVRLRRNQYTFSQEFDPMLAANLIYSPSYVSFETALAFYGLIPERTEIVLSVVDGRPQTIHTSVGDFEYISQSRTLFALGMNLRIEKGNSLAIASPEKALLDTLARANLKTATCSPAQILDYVVRGLRIERGDIAKLSLKKMRAMAPLYRNLAPRKLVIALAQKETAHE
jgi:hypothetical protein